MRMSDPNVQFIEHFADLDLQVLVIGTLDTKGPEIASLAGHIEALGARPVLIDSSGLPGANVSAVSRWQLIDREQVAAASGIRSEAIGRLPRGEAMAAVRVGVEAITVRLQAEGEIHAAVCLGGAAAHVAGPVFKALPIGFPRLIVSPLASGSRTFDPFVGTRDVAVMHSIADIVGVNAVTSVIYREAAGFIVGAAVAMRGWAPVVDLPAIAVSMNGNTTAPLMKAKVLLEQRGLAFVAFHANGVGGQGLEEFIASGKAVGVLDYTTTELGGHLIGGLMDSGPSRMQTAGTLGLPQVLVPGCVDFITCGRWEAAEAEFPGRVMFAHSPELTLVRLSASEMRRLGHEFARKANSSSTPITICVPRWGFSVNDVEGGLFWNPEADQTFIDALSADLEPRHRLIVLQHHIHDDEFVTRVVDELMERMSAGQEVAQDSSLEAVPQ